MSGLVDIVCQTMFPILRERFKKAMHEYSTNPKFHMKQFYDGEELTGFCVYNEEDGVRNIAELHYIGTNNFVALKMWRFLSKGAKKLKAQTDKCNIRMINIMKKLGFSVVGENDYILFLERVL